ncbi:MAG: hypothetical protein NTZ14_03020 [Hyphomicrobiales bacterium]|nr:hypothetical protein [Hyphomicrobiales bacterium]
MPIPQNRSCPPGNRHRPGFAFGRTLLLACALLFTGTILIRPADAQQRHVRSGTGQTEVYLLRGLFNVFSLGMDELGRKLAAAGIKAHVVNHAEWSSIASSIIESRSRGQGPARLVLIGHSLGGNDIILLAEKLGRNGVPVDLLIPVDATAPNPVPANVMRATNYFQSNNGFGSPLRAGPGFRGQLINADLVTNRPDLNSAELGHTSIDKSPRIHREIVGMVAALGRNPRHVAQRKPVRPAGQARTASEPAAPVAASAAAAEAAMTTGTIPAAPRP